jgi:hypothetical protein
MENTTIRKVNGRKKGLLAVKKTGVIYIASGLGKLVQF